MSHEYIDEIARPHVKPHVGADSAVFMRGVAKSHTARVSQDIPDSGTNLLFSAKNPGPRLNIKTVLSTYGDFHVKDKTAARTSYL